MDSQQFTTIIQEKMSADSNDDYETTPWKPLDSDCCGSGCNPCILDIYQQV